MKDLILEDRKTNSEMFVGNSVLPYASYHTWLNLSPSFHRVARNQIYTQGL